MMAAATAGLSSSPAFDEQNSLDESLEEFGQGDQNSPLFGLPSQHSGFKSSEEESSDQEEDGISEEPWSPPAWRSTNPAGGWYRHQPYLQDEPTSKHSTSASRSRENSHESYASAVEEEDDDTKKPSQIPLPEGSQSPAKERSPIKEEDQSTSPCPKDEGEFSPKSQEHEDASAGPESINNCLCPFVPYHIPFTNVRKTSVLHCAQKFSNVQNLLKPSPFGYEHMFATSPSHGALYHPSF